MVSVQSLLKGAQGLGGEGKGGVGYKEYERGLASCGVGAFNSYLLYGVGGGTESGSIDEPEEMVAKVKRCFYSVASGPGYGAYYGAVMAEQSVEQG